MVSVLSKAIGELTLALKESFTRKKKLFQDKSGRIRLKPQFTDDVKPICFKCSGVGHIAKECMQRNPRRPQGTPSTSFQEN